MIGVFDSGFGGLTIHRALTEALPQADFVYLGDNKNAPYGTRPPIDVLTLTCVGVERLFAQGCQLVIIACNTSSTIALRWIQQQWLPIQTRADGMQRNVLGVVVPTIEAVTGQRWLEEAIGLSHHEDSTVGIFATERTVQSETYVTEIHKRRPDIKVVQQACPGLVQMIENGDDINLMRAAVHRYVGEMHAQMDHQWPDRVILGCTHYPLVADLFAEALPPGMEMIDQRAATAAALVHYLQQHPEYAQTGTGQRKFMSTGFNPAALPLIEKFWGSPVDFVAAK